MRPITNAQDDPSASVEPPIQPLAQWRVRSVEVSSETSLHVTFVDGTVGDVEMREFLGSPTVAGTVFEALREPKHFRKAAIVLGAVTWPNGAGLAPDAMYDAVRENGRWILD